MCIMAMSLREIKRFNGVQHKGAATVHQFRLMHDKITLGLLEFKDFNFPVYVFKFVPSDAFESYRTLFDAEYEALSRGESASDLWREVDHIIRELNLLLIEEEDREEIKFSFLHIHGGEAWFR
jgi:hypothetical protein